MSQFGVQLHRKSHTKKVGNGKKKIKFRDKKRSEIGNYFVSTKLADVKEDKNKVKTVRRRGGRRSVVLKHAAYANVLTKEGYKKVKIKGVLESKDNKNFARQNIITKGTILNTELGKVEVINRPGRDGSINAKLVGA
ncbi:MAG: 30S ribosomal protein S8e [Candidatus Marsarchaeota archaeon]|jgi:small subunit ribosomal protein S8e|nr:30S ribosomal protein S8e [Candidatus Marsarchaeota archaeon]